MVDVVAQRRAFVRQLEATSLTTHVDWTRDGYQTAIVGLGELDDPEDQPVVLPAWVAQEALDEFELLIERTEDETPDPLTGRTFRARNALRTALQELTQEAECDV